MNWITTLGYWIGVAGGLALFVYFGIAVVGMASFAVEKLIAGVRKLRSDFRL